MCLYVTAVVLLLLLLLVSPGRLVLPTRPIAAAARRQNGVNLVQEDRRRRVVPASTCVTHVKHGHASLPGDFEQYPDELLAVSAPLAHKRRGFSSNNIGNSSECDEI